MFQTMNPPKELQIDNNTVTMVAERDTNLFNDMCSDYRCSDFPFYCKSVEGDFIISCKVTPEFKSLYDLGSIVIFENENKWIKFAFENSDAGYPAIVSVITNTISDDCNGAQIKESGVWMRITRKENNFALHYSLDKKKWLLARIFRLDLASTVMAGVSAQSPTGESCKVTFENLEIVPNISSTLVRQG